MTCVATAPHELEGNLIYCDHGLSPYWILTTLLTRGYDGHGKVEVDIGGETWTVSLTYQMGGVAPRPDDRVDGERLYELRIGAYGRGQRKANYLIQPRFEDMRHYETGEKISTPFDHIEESEGVNVRFGGSNLEPDDYTKLLPQFVQALASRANIGVNKRYLTTRVHEMSNITTYERYVRVNRRWSSKLVGRTGTIQRLMQLYAEEVGSEFELKVNNNDTLGYNTRAVLAKQDAQQLIPGHRHGKQIKHYHPKHVRTNDSGDSLYHPKLGVLLKKSLNGHSFAWSDRKQLRREIDETVLNVLYWGDVPIRPDPTTFISDDHFEVRETNHEVSLVSDPTPDMEASQEALLVTTLRDLTDSDMQVLESLVTDGGRQHPQELANNTGRGISTIYRALDRLNGIVRNHKATVSFISKKIAQEVSGIVERAELQIGNAADRVAKLLNIETRGAASSAWDKFCTKYAAKIVGQVDEADGQTLRIDTLLSKLRSTPEPLLSDVLHEALDAWHSDSRDVKDLRTFRLQWRNESGEWCYGRVNPNLH